MRRHMHFNQNRFILILLLVISISGSYGRSSAIMSEKLNKPAILDLSSSLSNENNGLDTIYHPGLFIQEGVFRLTDEVGMEEYFNSLLNITNPIPETLGLTGENVTIAILDSGINYTDWIEIDRIINRSRMAPDTSFYDEIGHGTQVASIISKIAPQADLISIKISDQNNTITKEYVDKGLRRAQTLNASIIHASFGSPDLFSVNSTLIDELIEQNITLIFSAGNEGPYGMSITSPAIFDKAIAVGMTFNETHIPYSTSTGPRSSGLLGPDILAPGVAIPSYSHTGEPVNVTGTSYAAPFVTAGVALLKQAFPTYSPSLLKTAIVASAQFINETSPIVQGNGLFNLNSTYNTLSSLNSTPILSLSPKVISSDFAYYGNSINGQERKYRIGVYSSTQMNFTRMNSTELEPIEIASSFANGSTIPIGYSTFNLTIKIPKNLPMETWSGNVTFTFENQSTNLTVVIKNKYPSGRVLFYQGFDNDSYIPDGPTGTFSQLKFLLENFFGMQVTGLVRSSLGLVTTDPLTLDIDNELTIDDLNEYDILILADPEFNITTSERETIQDWVNDDHSLLVLSYPSLIPSQTETLSNSETINDLLIDYGISIMDDDSKPDFVHFSNATASGNPITKEEIIFDYNGTSVGISGEKAHSLANATDLIDEKEKPVAAYWENGASKVAVFGGLTPFDDLSFFSPNLLNNYQLISKIFSWMILDQQTPLEVILTSNPTAGTQTRIQITLVSDKSYDEAFNGTIIEDNGSYTQIEFKFSINTFIGKWIPKIEGQATLWLNLQTEGKIPTNGLYSITVYRGGEEFLFYIFIFSSFVLVAIGYYMISSRRNNRQQLPLEQQFAMRYKQTDSKTGSKTLEIQEVCPRCRTHRFNPNSKYCFKCGKEL